jgi:hypothetical protein
MSTSGRAARLCGLAAVAFALAGGAFAKEVDITTYHYDNFRTGWNAHEKTLTPANVAGPNFKLIASTVLDDQVDAQPLILTHQTVKGKGAHDVVYIATESNSVYAIDANSGEILRQVNLGAPVPRNTLPGGCTNGGPNLGINSTPAIDPVSHTIYLVAYTYEKEKPVWRVHALDPSSLADLVKPVVVKGKGLLSDGTTYAFDPHESRQRAALLLANGNLYAGFASFCDYDANLSRGWVLGWQAGTLKPLPANELTDKLAKSTDNFFLSSIWMSGYGLAGSAAGDVYFITGNSDFAGNSYDPVLNISESVAQMSSDLSTVEHLYTPMGGNTGWQELDMTDGDFGAGGFMLLPAQKGQPTNLAVAAGKAGVMYVFNADDVSNGNPNGGTAYSSVTVGPCWCGPSYYMGSDGVGRVVSSSNNTVGIWKIKPKGTPGLVYDNSPGSVEGAFFPGFFTSVSSDGSKPATTVVWAVGRPTDFNQEVLKLHAFDPEQAKQIFVTDVGYWTNSEGDSNIVPVTANGKVYVATVKSLAIYGVSNAPAGKLPPPPKIVDTRLPLAAGQHEIRGTVRRMTGNTLLVEKRDGSKVTIDDRKAIADYKFAVPSVGHALVARGAFAGGVLRAELIGHAPDHPMMWPPDR